MTLLRKRNNESLPSFTKIVLDLAEKNEKIFWTLIEIHGTGKLDSERKKCPNRLHPVGKQTLLFETGFCTGYVTFYKSLLS